MKTLATTGQDWMMADFRASAVPDRLTLFNVQWIQGDDAIQVLCENRAAQLQNVTEYATKPVAQLLKRYEFAAAGGWLAYGCNLDGEAGQSPYFKPWQPRQMLKNGRLKSIKYETPAGMPALPLLPLVDEGTAQAIYARYGVQPLPGENFWQCVWRCNLPIAVTEGLKKALALIAHGLPAIAVRGITQWHKKGTNELHDEIAQFATPSRQVHVIYDADDRARTLRDIRRETLNLGAALEQAGCRVSVPTWNYELGKGIDDVLFGKNSEAEGSEAQSWFDQLLASPPSLADFKRDGPVAAAIAVIDRHNKLSIPAERVTTGHYLPQLPPLQAGNIHVIKAPTGTGKSTAIGRDWVKPAIAAGWNVLVLSPLNSLGRQIAASLGLPHIHDFGTNPNKQAVLWAMVSAQHGLVCCPDSLHRLPDGFWSQPLLLVLDEANQVVNHLVTGDTLGPRWSDILERFAAAARHAAATGAIVMAEATLPDRAVDFVKKVSGCQDVRVFKHKTAGDRSPVTILDGSSTAFRAELLSRVGQGKRLVLKTSSQREARYWEEALKRLYPDKKVVRVDSDTNEGGQFTQFFESPDRWLEENQPDVLILSPSAKSGLSIEGGVPVENAYFDEVWGYFPSLATDTHLQMLARFRPAVPRFVYVPPFIMAGHDESLNDPSYVKRRLQQNLEKLAGAFGLEELLAGDDRAAQLIEIEAAVLDYLSATKTVEAHQKAIAREALIHDLEAANHQITSVKVKADKAIAQLWKEIAEQVARDDAQEFAQLQPPAGQTSEQAAKVLAGRDASRLERLAARKTLLRDEFLGISFDDEETCYQAITKNYGAMRRGVLLQAHAENLEAVKAADADVAAKILAANIKALHRLPKNYARALLIAKTGILELLDGQAWSNTDARAIAVKRAALHWAREIAYWLRLRIDETQTATEIVNKLIRKLGLKAIAVSRLGRRCEARHRQWGIDDFENPIRAQLLKTLRLKLSGSVSTIRNSKNLSMQIVDTAPSEPQNPPLIKNLLPGAAVRWAAGGLTGQLVELTPAGALFKPLGGGQFYLPLGELQAA